MEREGYMMMEDVFLSWPRWSLSGLTFIFIRNAKSSFMMEVILGRHLFILFTVTCPK